MTVYVVMKNGVIDSAWQDESDAMKQAAVMGEGYVVDECYAWKSADEFLAAVGD